MSLLQRFSQAKIDSPIDMNRSGECGLFIYKFQVVVMVSQIVNESEERNELNRYSNFVPIFD